MEGGGILMGSEEDSRCDPVWNPVTAHGRVKKARRLPQSRSSCARDAKRTGVWRAPRLNECGRQESNLHVVKTREPKSRASASSATPAAMRSILSADGALDAGNRCGAGSMWGYSHNGGLSG